MNRTTAGALAATTIAGLSAWVFLGDDGSETPVVPLVPVTTESEHLVVSESTVRAGFGLGCPKTPNAEAEWLEARRSEEDPWMPQAETGEDHPEFDGLVVRFVPGETPGGLAARCCAMQGDEQRCAAPDLFYLSEPQQAAGLAVGIGVLLAARRRRRV